MMSILRPILALGAVVLGLIGCAGPSYRSEPPAPVEHRGAVPPQSRVESPSGSYRSQPGAPEIRPATPPPQTPISGSRIEPGGERDTRRPAPVESRDPSEVAIYAPPDLPASSRATPSRAVQALITRADAQARAGDFTNAAATLERALRIDSKDALLWNKLAHVRFQQARHQVAEELAAKSNNLAHGADFDLRRDNWLLISKARRAAGNRVGAGEALRRAEQMGSR